jgi:TolB-like protein
MAEEHPQESQVSTAPAPSIGVWTRIKEHKIAQWTLAYAAAAYALLDGTKIVSDTFEWPHLVARTVTVLLFLGLPLVVTLAWYHGHRALRRVSGAELTIITVLLVVAGAVLWHFARATQEAPALRAAATAPTTAVATPAVAISDKSIAVLPFVDMSEKHDQEYFSDGLSEELIDHLAHIPDLKVIARTSAFAFKGKNEDMRTIAAKLGVANLLEGSVRKAGGELRITAQLIRASDGVHLWSEIYDRKLIDIFKVQDEISRTVAKALNAALNGTPASGAQSAAKGTTNIEAYNLVLQGNYFLSRFDKGDVARAIEQYRRAVRLDRQYVLAWAKLARAYANLEVVGDGQPASEATIKGRDAAEQALAIDPNCAEAYYARGAIRSFLGDWAGAQSDYERAAALDPYGEVGDSAEGKILFVRAQSSAKLGDFIYWVRRRLERDPLDTNSMFSLAISQQVTEHLDESAATFRKILERDPAFLLAPAQYGMTLLLMGRNAEAFAAAQNEADEETKLWALACIYWAMGQRAKADSALGMLEHGWGDQSAYDIAAVHAYRGEADAAFAWLDRAYNRRKGSLGWLKVDPLFRNLRSDPRFDAWLRKAKLLK